MSKNGKQVAKCKHYLVNNTPLTNMSQSLAPFKRIDRGLLLYYQAVGANDYLDMHGVGLFGRWCANNQFEDDDEDDVANELADGNEDNCAYLDFTEDFPFSEALDSASESVKRTEQFRVMQYCYHHGVPPPDIAEENDFEFEPIDPENPMRPFKFASKGTVDTLFMYALICF